MGRQTNRERERETALEAWQRASLGCGVGIAGVVGQCGKKAHRAHEKCIFEFNRKINKRNNNSNNMWRMGDFFLAYLRAEPKSMQQ